MTNTKRTRSWWLFTFATASTGSRSPKHSCSSKFDRMTRMRRAAVLFSMRRAHFRIKRSLLGLQAHVSWVHPGKSLTIPVTIDGKQAKYFIDTGAILSTISDADAQRLGLEVHQANLKLAGSAGQSASFKIANAKHVKIGSFELENVVFAVSPANQPPFNDMSSLEQPTR